MKVLLFGMAREIVGNSSWNVEPMGEHWTVAELRTKILETYPEFQQFSSFLIAVNQEYAGDDQLITSLDEIAIIPPVSGG